MKTIEGDILAWPFFRERKSEVIPWSSEQQKGIFTGLEGTERASQALAEVTDSKRWVEDDDLRQGYFQDGHEWAQNT